MLKRRQERGFRVPEILEFKVGFKYRIKMKDEIENNSLKNDLFNAYGIESGKFSKNCN